MCTTLQTAQLGVGGFSALSSGIGAFSKSRRDKNALKIQADVARRNQEIAAIEEANAQKRGLRTEQASRRATRALQGTQRAGLAGSGVDVNFGSPVDVVGDSDIFGEFDVGTIRQNTADEVFAAKARGQGFGFQADSFNRAGRGVNPALDFGSSLLGGGADVGLRFLKFRER